MGLSDRLPSLYIIFHSQLDLQHLKSICLYNLTHSYQISRLLTALSMIFQSLTVFYSQGSTIICCLMVFHSFYLSYSFIYSILIIIELIIN